MSHAGAPPPVSPGIAPFINKSVPFRFDGAELELCLSHGLFSSFDIDDGTRLLLKSIAQRVDLDSLETALDVGCGVGVIGAGIAARAPAVRVTMQDRDALAVAVAQENCRRNGLAGAAAECGLAFHGLGRASFDLVTSNLPAKAGAAVLEAMLRHAAGCLAPRGIAAVVIVAPLAEFARQAITSMGAEMRHAEEGRAYSVFHFAAGSVGHETDREREDLSPYVRGRHRFQRGDVTYTLDTAYSLPGFDTLGHDLELCMDLLVELDPPGGRPATAFWNPGQGHLPAAFLGRFGAAGPLTLAARDCLECRITARNLSAAGIAPSAEHALYSERELGETVPESSWDLLVAVPHPVPRSPWQTDLARAAVRALKPGGTLLVVGTSTEMHRFLQVTSGLVLIASRKREGFRAAGLRKPATPP